MDKKVYEFESLIYDAGKSGGAYVVFPYNIKEEFGKGRVKVHVTFDGEPYDGSIVNMGVKDADGRICYIIGIRKDIRARIKKQQEGTLGEGGGISWRPLHEPPPIKFQQSNFFHSGIEKFW